MKAIETKLVCKNCGRFLATAIGNVKIDSLICARCKFRNKYDIRTGVRHVEQKS